MKIALIIENSQAAKSSIVHDALKSVAEPLGHQVHHYGMYGAEDKASLEAVHQAFARAGFDVRELIVAIAKSDSFRHGGFDQGNTP